MREYDVTITETLQRVVKIKAENKAEAEELVEEKWGRSEYVLDADDFMGADFHAKESMEKVHATMKKKKDYER